jgi:hypothetical protein
MASNPLQSPYAPSFEPTNNKVSNEPLLYRRHCLLALAYVRLSLACRAVEKPLRSPSSDVLTSYLVIRAGVPGTAGPMRSGSNEQGLIVVAQR